MKEVMEHILNRPWTKFHNLYMKFDSFDLLEFMEVSIWALKGELEMNFFYMSM